MAESQLFDLGFSADKPTPQEIDSLPSRIAIADGTRKGIINAATSLAQQAINPAVDAADSIVGAAVEPANDAIGSAGAIAQGLIQHGQQAAINALQQPLAAGLSLGYQSQGTPLLNAPGRKKRQSRRNSPPPTEASSSGETAGIGPPPPTAEPVPIQKPIGSQPSAWAGKTCGWLVFRGPLLNPNGEAWGVQIADAPGFSTAGYDSVAYYDTIAAARAANPGLSISGTGADCVAVASGPGGTPSVTAAFPPPFPRPMPPSVTPLPPPAPPPCPCPNISILVPLPAQPPPNISIMVPPCPNCGQQGSPIVIPTPQLPPVVNLTVPPPVINLDVPPCPNCGTQIPPINITIPGASLSVPGGGAVGATVPAGPPPPPSPPGAPPAPCDECTIAFLSYKYPHFVIASRAAQKTDYDILVDALKLKLCCGLAQQPGCSMPYLERMVPEFVAAAKAQGLSDDELLQQAVNIGLCADVPAAAGLGEQNVGYTAPGSALATDAEFDPPVSGQENTRGKIPIHSDATDFCPASIPVLPDLGQLFGLFGAKDSACLGGLAQPVQTLISGVRRALESACSCDGSNALSMLGLQANKAWNTQTWIGKATYYVLQAFIWLMRTGACNISQIANMFSSATGCQADALIEITLTSLLIGVWERWVGKVPENLYAILQRVADFNCPIGVPNPAEASDLRATKFISKDDWECYLKANGVRPDLSEPLYAARQRRPDDENLWLFYRQLLAWKNTGVRDGAKLTASELKQINKEIDIVENIYAHNGWTNPDWFGAWQDSRANIPSTQDAIEWMIKDVNDPQIQQTFLLDAEFKQKFGGRVEQVFGINGVRNEDAQNYWRAHWRNVAPHQLYEMHKRLRPGWTQLMTDAEVMSYVQAICPRKTAAVTAQLLAERPESNGFKVPTYCDEVADPVTARAYLESIVVTGYHVSEALGQDDFPAFWRPRLLALSYNVLTRVDARRAYELGQFTDEKLVSIYEDRGYKHSDAVVLVDFAHAQLVQKFARSPTGKEWVQYPYQISLLFDNLKADGMRADLWDEVYEILRLKRSVYLKVQQMAQIKKAAVAGRINKADASAKIKQILGGA